MDLSLVTTAHADHVVVACAGELDMATAPALRDHLLATLARTDHLVLDLRDVAFMDSTGLQALISTRRRASISGEKLSLVVAPQSAVERVLELTGVTDLFHFRTPEEPAPE